ncbi:MAG TPA: hypothetical protein VFH68_21080 [Polyangia bacterium]|jgi:hypothetical protein|nr:hypothetical protein [Polyangia bacterium]
MESNRLTGQGIRDLNDRGPKKKPAAAEIAAPDTGGEEPVTAAAPEAAHPAHDAPAEPATGTDVATTEHHG